MAQVWGVGRGEVGKWGSGGDWGNGPKVGQNLPCPGHFEPSPVTGNWPVRDHLRNWGGTFDRDIVSGAGEPRTNRRVGRTCPTQPQTSRHTFHSAFTSVRAGENSSLQGRQSRHVETVLWLCLPVQLPPPVALCKLCDCRTTQTQTCPVTFSGRSAKPSPILFGYVSCRENTKCKHLPGLREWETPFCKRM
jgi:hypothetical protein